MSAQVWRVSDVESFRQWEQDEDLGEAWLLTRLRHEDETTPAQAAGTALHRALELAHEGEADELAVGDYLFRFPADAVVVCPAIRERRGARRYMVDGQPIVISGQVDGLDGVTIYDHKSTARLDLERYLEGYQWRLYLHIFGAARFVWQVFVLAPGGHVPEGEAEYWEDGRRVYVVREVHQLEQHRYPAMEADCQALVERFARFVRERVEVAA